MNHRRYTYLVGENILLLKRRYTSFLRETHRSLMRSGMGVLLLWLLLLTACVGEELQKPILGEGEGYLRLQVAPVSAEITTSPLTKATISTPDKDELTINIKQGNTSVSGFPKKYTELTDPIVLHVGTYTVEAYHGKNGEIELSPYFNDSTEITIDPLTASEVSLTPSLANAMLVPVVNNDLKKHYSEWKLSVKAGSSSQDLASNSMERYLYVQNGLPIEITFSGRNLINGSTSKTEKVTDAAQPRTQYTIQCNPENLPEFTLETTATVEHTENGGKLDGTRVQVYATKLEGTRHELITGWKAELYNANNTLVRTYSASSAPTTDEKNDMLAESGWPYLPQGKYTLRSTLTLLTGESTTEHVTTVTVPAPEFLVTASAYTSYNKYLEHDLDGETGANKIDGSTIYDMKAVPTIAPELLNNTNYTQSSALTLDGEPVSAGAKDSQTWKAHTLVASYTFDGVTVESAPTTYHVTGLPFSAVPPKIKGDHAWTYDALDAWKGTDEYARIGNKGAGTTTLQSPYFHVPIDIPIQLSTRYQVYGATKGTTFEMYLGDEQLWTTTAKDGENTGSWIKPNYVYDRPTIEDSKESTITATNNYIKCINSYSLGETHSKVYYVNIYYR